MEALNLFDDTRIGHVNVQVTFLMFSNINQAELSSPV